MKVPLFCMQTQQEVPAKVIPLAREHIMDFWDYWRPELSNANEEDSHWNWIYKLASPEYKNCETYALECGNNPITQGLMMIKLDFNRSILEPGKDLIHVEYLHIAPWNRKTLRNPVRYKAIGPGLLNFALMRSFEVEYAGRIGLCSLPRAEDAYVRFGMSLLNNTKCGNLKYFELSREKAEEIRKEFED